MFGFGQKPRPAVVVPDLQILNAMRGGRVRDEDRIAERVLPELMRAHGIRAGSLDMNVKEVTEGAYRIARFMMAAQRSSKGRR